MDFRANNAEHAYRALERVCADLRARVATLEADERDPNQGVGISAAGEMSSGELPLVLNVEGREGTVYLSRQMWEVLGEKAGWSPPEGSVIAAIQEFGEQRNWINMALTLSPNLPGEWHASMRGEAGGYTRDTISEAILACLAASQERTNAENWRIDSFRKAVHGATTHWTATNVVTGKRIEAKSRRELMKGIREADGKTENDE